ncbi:alpha/beta fold hydrolase [Undibacterium sp. Ren11W]|uniref:alpha/beta fold hydrolase n=1 Tax=Undibacterium sp. Ren11W TaxID=3413045 RepID=UPI003BF1A22B
MNIPLPEQPTTWVLLRGLMREKRHWGEFAGQFQTALGAPVVCLDFSGNGSLHARRSSSSVAAMRQELREQLQQLGHAPPYRVLALSLGAMVAVDWATQFPNEVEKLVLINTSLAPYNPFYQRLRPQNYPALLQFLCAGSLAQREALILRLTSQQSGTTRAAAILEQWLSYAKLCTITRSNILRQLYAAIRYRAAPVAPAVPLLLLGGQHDQLVNVQCSITLAQRWLCPLKLHPSASHDIPLDDAAWVIQQIRMWLNQVEV